jgi:hypothetical protein
VVLHHFDADTDADPDTTYHPDVDPDADFLLDADPNPTFTLMRIRIQILASKKSSNNWKSVKICSYSMYFVFTSAN